MHRLIAILFLVTSGVVCAEKSDLLLTPEEHVALRAAESEGLAIYRHDRAAWLATDTLLENRSAKKDKRITGWVTEDVSDGLRVTFVGAKNRKAPFYALYRITVMDNSKKKPIEVVDPPEQLSTFERSAMAVRDTVARSKFQACSPNYNSVVLPPRGDSKEWTVYMLPGTTKAEQVPAGGTHRFRIDPADVSTMTSRTYTKSCIILDNRPEAVSLMITHLLDPTPTEAHVFWSLSARKELMVITPQGSMWKVRGAEIELLERSVREG